VSRHSNLSVQGLRKSILKLRYSISPFRKIFHKRKILAFVICLVILIPVVRSVYGINLAAPIIQGLTGISSTDLPTLKGSNLRRLEIGERLRCSLKHTTSRLPLYEIRVSESDMGKLRNTIQGIGRSQQKSFAQVEVRYSQFEKEAEILTARMRKRARIIPAEGEQFHFKLEFKKPVFAKSNASHLIFLGRIGPKQNMYWPFHMWLADNLGLITPRSRIVRVKINGLFWGLFWEFEPWGKATLDQHNIASGSLFAESDDYPFVIARYLWKNLDQWKKYDTGFTNPDDENDFSHMADLLWFINHADEKTFNREVYNYVNFDNVVAWATHMTIMDSYHQDFFQNGRLLYNNMTGKFSMIPWDAITELSSRINGRYRGSKIFANHPLLIRLFNEERFYKAYTKKVGNFTRHLEKELNDIFSNLYLTNDLVCAATDTPFYQNLTNGDLFRLGRIKQLIWASRWREQVGCPAPL